jgi:hypothetical protein
MDCGRCIGNEIFTDRWYKMRSAGTQNASARHLMFDLIT